jgi:hypothetical protein
MAIVDPGPDAVGFEIDACLPAPGGGLACASDSHDQPNAQSGGRPIG